MAMPRPIVSATAEAEAWLLRALHSHGDGSYQIQSDSTLGLSRDAALALCAGEWATALESTAFSRHLAAAASPSSSVSLGDLVEAWISYDDKDPARRFDVLVTGIAALMLFVEGNWGGRPTPEADIRPCVVRFARHMKLCVDKGEGTDVEVDRDLDLDRAAALRGLKANGEEVYTVMHHPHLLSIARNLLVEHVRSRLAGLPSASLWGARVCRFHQMLVHQPSADLKAQTFALIGDALKAYTDIGMETCGGGGTGRKSDIGVHLDLDLSAMVWLENGHCELQYNCREAALKSFIKAKECLGLSVELAGARGKRMRFQSFTTPQLILKVVRKHDQVEGQSQSQGGGSGSGSGFPPPLSLHYDARSIPRAELDELTELLDRPVLVSENKGKSESGDKSESVEVQWESGRLSALEQEVLLGLAEGRRINNPDRETQAEEVLPYLWRVEDGDPASLAVHVTCLLLESRMERNKNRSKDRAVNQLENVVDVLRLHPSKAQAQATVSSTPPQPQPPLPHRPSPLYMNGDIDIGKSPIDLVAGVFSSGMPPIWRLMSELSAWFMDDSRPSDALRIAMELSSWEGILRCHVAMQQTVKAERMLRAKLKDLSDGDPEAPVLWCLLGDMASDESCYRRAWRISGERSAHAMRCLGHYHFKKDEISKASECFKKSLKISPLSPDTWFTLGHTLMRLGKYSKATTCFGRVVQLEPLTGSAWANLGTLHLLLKQPRQALGALREAVKTERSNWKMLQNMLMAAAGCGAWQEAVHAMQRLIDVVGLRGVDWDILRHAVHATVTTKAELREREERLAEAKNEATREWIDDKAKVKDDVEAKVEVEAEAEAETGKAAKEKEKEKGNEPQYSYAYQYSFTGDLDGRRRLGSKLAPLLERVLGLIQEEMVKKADTAAGTDTNPPPAPAPSHPGPATLLDFLARVLRVSGDWEGVLSARHTVIDMFRASADHSNVNHFESALALIEPLVKLGAEIGVDGDRDLKPIVGDDVIETGAGVGRVGAGPNDEVEVEVEDEDEDETCPMPKSVIPQWRKSLKDAIIVLLDDWFGNAEAGAEAGAGGSAGVASSGEVKPSAKVIGNEAEAARWQSGLAKIQEWLGMVDGDVNQGDRSMMVGESGERLGVDQVQAQETGAGVA